MKGLCIFLGVMFLLYWLPLGIRGLYRKDGARVWVIAGPFRIPVFPRKKKAVEEEAEEPQEKKKTKKTPKPKKETKQGGSVKDFLPLAKVALDFLGSFRRKLRIRNLEMKLVMAGGDPCDLAVNYGKAWAALGNVLPRLEAIFTIKKRNLEVECDFTAEETTIYTRGDITITLGRLLCLTAKYGYRAVREYLKLRKKRKGAQHYEQKSS